MAEERKYLSNGEKAVKLAIHFLKTALDVKAGTEETWSQDLQDSQDKHMQDHLDEIEKAWERSTALQDWTSDELGALACTLSHLGSSLNEMFPKVLEAAILKGADVVGPDSVLELIDEETETKH